MTEPYAEHKFWRHVQKDYATQFIVVAGRRGTAAGATEFPPKDVRQAFEAYWLAVQEERGASSEALETVCKSHSIPFFKNWLQLENDMNYPYREAVAAAVAAFADFPEEQ